MVNKWDILLKILLLRIMYFLHGIIWQDTRLLPGAYLPTRGASRLVWEYIKYILHTSQIEVEKAWNKYSLFKINR
jgi:hypothetical protein